jgi:hypothetical protein
VKHLTSTQIARHFGTTEHRARKAIDSLGETIPRIGPGIRLVPETLLPQIAERIGRNNRK